MNMKEVIMAASGSIDGKTKSAIGLFHEIWHTNGDTTPVQQISLEKPVVNIFRHAGYVQVDLVFISKFDADLRNIWDMLTRFCEPENSMDDETDEMPTIVLAIYPTEFEGKYYILATNPIFFTLQPEDASGDPCVIRLIFDEEEFTVFEEDDEDVMEEIMNEITEELDLDDKYLNADDNDADDE